MLLDRVTAHYYPTSLTPADFTVSGELVAGASFYVSYSSLCPSIFRMVEAGTSCNGVPAQAAHSFANPTRATRDPTSIDVPVYHQSVVAVQAAGDYAFCHLKSGGIGGTFERLPS